MALPVLEGALERSIDLAASMDSRGYGRRGTIPSRQRQFSQALTLGGALILCVGVFGVLDRGAPRYLGIPLVAVGGLLLAISLRVAHVTANRSQYRPDPWRLPEWLTVLCGVAACGALVAAGHMHVEGLNPEYSPLRAPTLPWLPAMGILLAALPAFVTPPLPAEMS
jgi:energy-coupling factor transport system permease protein